MPEQDQPIPTEAAPGQAAPNAASEAPGDEPAAIDLAQQLREAEAKLAEHLDAWLRAKADADNARKRAQIDIANAHKFGVETFAASLLPVRDSLEAALTVENATVESLRSGVELTLKQLAAAFEKAHVRVVDPAGEKFDPHLHQAISMLPSDREPNTVIDVLQKGFLLHERVLRPALVVVAAGKDA